MTKSDPGGDHAPTKFSISESQGDKSACKFRTLSVVLFPELVEFCFKMYIRFISKDRNDEVAFQRATFSGLDQTGSACKCSSTFILSFLPELLE